MLTTEDLLAHTASDDDDAFATSVHAWTKALTSLGVVMDATFMRAKLESLLQPQRNSFTSPPVLNVVANANEVRAVMEAAGPPYAGMVD